MTGDELRLPVLKEWNRVDEELAGDILGRRRRVREGGIILVQEFVVEPIAQDFSHPLLDLADVHQHSGGRIDRAGKNKVGDVVPPGAVARRGLRPERGEILRVAPFFDEEAAGGGKFEPLADG